MMVWERWLMFPFVIRSSRGCSPGAKQDERSSKRKWYADGVLIHACIPRALGRPVVFSTMWTRRAQWPRVMGGVGSSWHAGVGGENASANGLIRLHAISDLPSQPIPAQAHLHLLQPGTPPQLTNSHR